MESKASKAAPDTIAIIGAGALGAIYASILYDSSPDSVCFIAAGERYERLKRDGVVVNGNRYAIPVRLPDEGKPVDLLMVAVKHHHLDQAIRDMKSAVGPRTQILSVMNGIDSEERIGAVYGTDKVLFGLALGIDAVRRANVVTYKNQGRILFGERTNKEVSDRVSKVRGIFDRAGIAYEVPEDMIRALWFKYMINVGVNQVSAVTGATYGGLRSSVQTRALMDAAMREVIAIARAKGVALTGDDIARWYQVLNSLDPDGKTSMLQDVEARRKTEVEMLAGAVIELGKRHCVATPVNEQLFKELRAREASRSVSCCAGSQGVTGEKSGDLHPSSDNP